MDEVKSFKSLLFSGKKSFLYGNLTFLHAVLIKNVRDKFQFIVLMLLDFPNSIVTCT
jgi:hypothetical protein